MAKRKRKKKSTEELGTENELMKLKMMAEFGGNFVGSDDMLALLANHQYGFNFYIGGNIPFYKIRPKDDDGDHVSNRRDRCPRLQGTWENHGCPVEDKGKTADKADATEN